jgi:hypothetical protein
VRHNYLWGIGRNACHSHSYALGVVHTEANVELQILAFIQAALAQPPFKRPNVELPLRIACRANLYSKPSDSTRKAFALQSLISTIRGGMPSRSTMFKTIPFLLVAVLAAQSAYAQIPGVGPPPGAAGVAKSLGVPPPPPAPQITVDPPKPDKAPNLKVEAPGAGSVTFHGDPGKPAPDAHLEGHGAIPDAVNKANDTIQDAQKKVEDAAKQAAEFPLKAAEDALKIVGDAAKKAIEDIVAAAKSALEKQIDDLWMTYKWDVYLAGAALFTILMTPALIAAWIVRRIGRRRERRMQAALDQAMRVIKAYASQAGVKLPA